MSDITTYAYHGRTVDDYLSSTCSSEKEHGMFTLEYQWDDKPHRHVSDLCDWIRVLQRQIENKQE